MLFVLSEVMSSPTTYFESFIGKVLVSALVNCASIKPKDPIEYLSYEIERSSNQKKPHGKETKTQASLYFRKTFGNSLKQALFEAILMKPENPIAEVAGKLERKYLDEETDLRAKSKKVTRFYRQTAPIITDFRALTSKGKLDQLNFILPFLISR